MTHTNRNERRRIKKEYEIDKMINIIEQNLKLKFSLEQVNQFHKNFISRKVIEERFDNLLGKILILDWNLTSKEAVYKSIKLLKQELLNNKVKE
jgi:hypothetical protein